MDAPVVVADALTAEGAIRVDPPAEGWAPGRYTLLRVPQALALAAAPAFALPEHSTLTQTTAEGQTTYILEVGDGLTFPPEVSGETVAWLTASLAAQGVTSGAVALAEGSTAETQKAVRLLGVEPTVGRATDGMTEVKARTRLEVTASSIGAESGKLTLVTRVVAEAGLLSEPYAPSGTPQLLGSETLADAWEAIVPEETPRWIRKSDTEAEMALIIEPGNHRFFKVLVTEDDGA